MKKYLNLILVTLLLTGILFSCKKSNTPAPKDYSASIKDKTWWGEFAYTGKTAEYYSVHFNADNTLLWSQLSGDYAGTWVINNKSVTLKFSVSGAEIKADITDDDKLMAISDNTASYEINNGQLISFPAISLDNTIWKGTLITGISQQAMQLKFLPGSKVEETLGNTTYVQKTYSRPSSGRAFRFETGGLVYSFGVFISATEMKGSRFFSENPFQLTKQ